MKKLVLSVGLVGILLVASNLQAKNSPVTLTTKSYKEIVKHDSQGKIYKKLVEAKKVIPGDYVVYKNSISNNSQKSVKGMVLNNPVPKHTEYVEGSAKCKGGDCDILFSVDGGKKFDKPENLIIQKGNSKRLALAKDYTNIRWILTSSLRAKSSTEVSFKTQLQ